MPHMKVTTILIPWVLYAWLPGITWSGMRGSLVSEGKPQVGMPAANSAELEPDRPIRRALQPSQTDTYTVNGIAGNYLSIVVEQLGIDVVIAVTSPSGQALVLADSPNGSSGPEPGSLICPETGTYRVDVSSFSNARSVGEYSILVGKQHVATLREKKAVLALNSLFTATQLRHGDQKALLHGIQILENTKPTWSVPELRTERVVLESLLREELTSLSTSELDGGELQKAEQHSIRVVRLAHASHDFAAEGAACEQLGKVLQARGRMRYSRFEYRRSRELNRISLRHFIALRDYRHAGIVANEIGVTYLQSHAYGLAIEAYTKAKDLEARAGDFENEMTVLANIGTAYARDHNVAAAIQAYSQGLAVAQELKDYKFGARTLRLIGQQYQESENHDQALKNFNLAAAMSSLVGDTAGEANSLFHVAQEQSTLGYNEEALRTYRRSLSLDEERGDRPSAASTLADMAGINAMAGDRVTAKEQYEQALAIFRSVHDREQEATTLNALGGLYSDNGDRKAAEYLMREALEIRRQIKDDQGISNSLSDLAMLAADQGDSDAAINLYKQALRATSSKGHSEDTRAMMSNLAGAYADTGRLADAATMAGRAVSLARAGRLPSALAHSLNMAATVDLTLLKPDDAKRSLQEALDILQVHPDPGLESSVLHNLGELYSDEGYQRRAITYYERSLVIEERARLITTTSVTLGNIAAAYVSLHQYSKALPYLLKALPITRAARDRAGEAATLILIGECLEQDDYEPGTAASFFFGALKIADDLHQPTLDMAVHADLMGHFMQKAPNAAILFGKLAIQDIGKIRGHIRQMDRSTRARVTWSHASAFRTTAELMIKRGRLAEAEAALDQLKTEELQELTKHNGASTQTVLPMLELNQEEKRALHLFEQASAASTEVIAQVLGDRISEQEGHQDQAAKSLDSAEVRDFDNMLSSAASDTQRPKPVVAESGSTSEGNLRPVEPGVLLLYTFVGTDDAYILVNTHGSIKSFPLGISPESLSTLVLGLRGHLNEGDSQSVADLTALGQLLLAPIEKYLASAAQDSPDHIATLLWSLDGVLRYVPVGALYNDRRFLLERARNVVITPDSWSHLADRPHLNQPLNVLAFGLSESYLGLPPLKNVIDELAAVVRNSGAGYPDGALPGTAFINSGFTLATLKRELRTKHSVIHIASHFVLEYGHSGDSYLLLSGERTSGTGFKLKLSTFEDDKELSFDGVQLVTLSACSTGEADTADNGQEMDSLGMVLQRRGAAAILATLWRVNDRSTSIVMGEFYRRWLSRPNLGKGEALRQAQLALKNTRPNPRYWAPFALIGDYH